MTDLNEPGAIPLDALAGGGAAVAMMRSLNWGRTSLGSAVGWPQALKTLVGLMLSSRQPMFLAWGSDRIWISTMRSCQSWARGTLKRWDSKVKRFGRRRGTFCGLCASRASGVVPVRAKQGAPLIQRVRDILREH
jgi:hypothetical protein